MQTEDPSTSIAHRATATEEAKTAWFLSVCVNTVLGWQGPLLLFPYTSHCGGKAQFCSHHHANWIHVGEDKEDALQNEKKKKENAIKIKYFSSSERTENVFY